MLPTGKNSEERTIETIRFAIESKKKQAELFEEIYKNTYLKRIKSEFDKLESEKKKLDLVNAIEVKIINFDYDDTTYSFNFRADELAVFYNDDDFLQKIRSLTGHEFRPQVVEAYILSTQLRIRGGSPSIERLHHFIRQVKATDNKLIFDKNLALIFNFVSAFNCYLANQSNDFNHDFVAQNQASLKETLNLLHDTGWRVSLKLGPIEKLEYTRGIFSILSAYLPIEETYRTLEREFSEPCRGEWFSELTTTTGESGLCSLMNSFYRQGVRGKLPDQKYTEFLRLALFLIRHGSRFFENNSILLSMIPGDLSIAKKIEFLFECRSIKNEEKGSPSITQFYRILDFLRAFNEGHLADIHEVFALIDESAPLLDANQLAFFSKSLYEIYIHQGLHRTNNSPESEKAVSIICYLLTKMQETTISTDGFIAICGMFHLPMTEATSPKLSESDNENRLKIHRMIKLIVNNAPEQEIKNLTDGYYRQLDKYRYRHFADIHHYMLSRRSIYSRYDFLRIREYLTANSVFAEFKRTEDNLCDIVNIGFCINRRTRHFQAVEGNLFLSALANHDLDSAFDFLRMGISDIHLPIDASWSDSLFEQYTLASSLISVFFSLIEKQEEDNLSKLTRLIIFIIKSNMISLEEIVSLLNIKYLRQSIAIHQGQGSSLQGKDYLNQIFTFFSRIASLLKANQALSRKILLPYLEYSRTISYLEEAGDASEKATVLCKLLQRIDSRLLISRETNEMSFAFYLLQNLLNKKIIPPGNFMGNLIDTFVDIIENISRKEFETLLNESHGNTTFKQLIFNSHFTDLMLELIRVAVGPSGIYEEDVPGIILDYLTQNIPLSKDILCDIALNHITKLELFCQEAKFKNEASFTQALNVIEKVITHIPEDVNELFNAELIRQIEDTLKTYPPIKRALPSKGKSKNQFETLRLGPRFLALFKEFLQRALSAKKQDLSSICVTAFALETPTFPENREEAPIVHEALSLLGALPESTSHAGSAVAAASSEAANKVAHLVHKVALPKINNITRYHRVSDMKFMESADALDVIRLIKDPASEEELINMPLRESIKLLNLLIRRKDLSERLPQNEIKKLVFCLLHLEKIPENAFPDVFRCEWSGNSKMHFNKYYEISKSNHEKRFPKRIAETKQTTFEIQQTKLDVPNTDQKKIPEPSSSTSSSSLTPLVSTSDLSFQIDSCATETLPDASESQIVKKEEITQTSSIAEASTPSLISKSTPQAELAASSSRSHSDFPPAPSLFFENVQADSTQLRRRVREAALHWQDAARRANSSAVTQQIQPNTTPPLAPSSVKNAAQAPVNSGSDVVDSVLAKLEL